MTTRWPRAQRRCRKRRTRIKRRKTQGRNHQTFRHALPGIPEGIRKAHCGIESQNIFELLSIQIRGQSHGSSHQDLKTPSKPLGRIRGRFATTWPKAGVVTRPTVALIGESGPSGHPVESDWGIPGSQPVPFPSWKARSSTSQTKPTKRDLRNRGQRTGKGVARQPLRSYPRKCSPMSIYQLDAAKLDTALWDGLSPSPPNGSPDDISLIITGCRT